MRKILFRGKAIDGGGWVEGLYTNIIDTDYIIHPGIIVQRDSGIEWAEVDQRTMCEYTGLCDIYGVKIFENDLIQDNYGGDIWSVRYFDARFWGVDTRGRYSEEELGELADLMPGNFDGVIVVGNIYDNPELMEDKQC